MVVGTSLRSAIVGIAAGFGLSNALGVLERRQGGGPCLHSDRARNQQLADNDA